MRRRHQSRSSDRGAAVRTSSWRRLGAGVSVLAILLLPTWLSGQDPRPFELDDVFAIVQVSGVELSPAGDLAVVTTARWSTDRYMARWRTLWIVATAGGEPRRLVPDTTETTQERPAWSADGQRVAYVGTASDTSRLRVVRIGDREVSTPEPCPLDERIAAFAWAPAGARMAVLCERRIPPPPDTSTIIIASGSALYNDPGPRSFQRTLVVHEVDSGRNDVLVGDAPALAGDRFLQWDPSGSAIWFVGTGPGPDQGGAFTNGRYVYRVDLDSRAVRSLPMDTMGVQAPALSPDGGELIVPAGFRSISPDSETWPQFWRLRPLALNRVTADGRTLSVDTIPDGTTTRDGTLAFWRPAPGRVAGGLYFSLFERASQRVAVYDPASRTYDYLTPPDVHVEHYSVSADGSTMALVQGDVNSPNDVFIIDLRSPDRAARRLTRYGDAILTRYAVAPVERVSWRSADDRFTVDGFLMKPPDYVPGRRYPLILDVHGGPGVLYENAFERTHYEGSHQVPPELYAANGYMVLMANPRGDGTYGREFQEAILEGWQHPTRCDLIPGVVEMVRRGYADPARLGIAGGSYGGWVTTFAPTQTDIFRAGSANDPVVDGNISAVVAYRGARPSNYWLRAGFAGGLPGDAEVAAVDFRRSRTPLLLRFGLLGGGRTHPSQFFTSGLPLFVYMHTRSIPVEMIIHTDDGHGIFNWDRLRDYVDRNLAWFGYWLRDEPYPDPERQREFDVWKERFAGSGTIAPGAPPCTPTPGRETR